MPNHIQNRLKVIGDSEAVKQVLSFVESENKEGEKMQIDFNKIKPMPEELNMEIHSGIETWVEICTGQIDFTTLFSGLPSSPSSLFKSGNYGLLANSLAASTAMEHITGKRKGNVKDFTDKDFEIFIQGLRNARNHGCVSWYEWSKENWGTKWNAYDQNDERNTDNTIYFQTAWSSPIELISELSKIFPDVKLQLDYADEDSGSNVGKITLQNGEAIEVIQPTSQSKEAYDIYFELHPDSIDNYKLVDNKYEYIKED